MHLRSVFSKPGRLACAILLVLAVKVHAAADRALNDSEAGQTLAKTLRSLAPAEDSIHRGYFEIERPKMDDLVVPFVTVVSLTNGGWRTSYTASVAGGDEKLTVQHRLEQGATYMHTAPGRESVTLTGEQATNRFAGTDFILLDLGLEFFHWPNQALLTREMRKGRGCDVLESRPAKPGAYSRVVSWIDQETSGLLMAQAYGSDGKLLKEFEIRQVRKGQVEEMEIRNRQAKTSTRLRFLHDRK